MFFGCVVKYISELNVFKKNHYVDQKQGLFLKKYVKKIASLSQIGQMQLIPSYNFIVTLYLCSILNFFNLHHILFQLQTFFQCSPTS